MGGGGSPSNVSSITRQDLPEWAQPFGLAGMGGLLNLLYKDVVWIPDPDSPFKNKTKPVSAGTHDPNVPGSGYLDPLPYGGPDIPTPSGLSKLEQAGQGAAINAFKQGQPTQDAANKWLTDAMGGAGSNMAKDYESYLMGGPIAGASRTGLLDQLTGAGQQYGSQRLLDTIYGKTPQAAENALYGLIGPQSQLATDASTFDYAGPLAGAARGASLSAIQGKLPSAAQQSTLDTLLGPLQSTARGGMYDMMQGPLAGTASQGVMDTMTGRYLTPETNPYLKANVDATLKSIADAYQYGTAPTTIGDFAKAGSYGGSAYQQTKKMQQFDLAKSLSDAANQAYGANYAQERQAQLAAQDRERATQTGAVGQERQTALTTAAQQIQDQLSALAAERGISEQALAGERGRQFTAQQGSLSAAIQAALDQQGGYRSLLDSALNRGASTSEGMLNRGVQAASLVPNLIKSNYTGADVLSQLGLTDRQIADAQAQAKYQNDLTKYQWPFNLLNILSSGIAGFTGGQSVTTATSPNPNAVNPWATGAGAGLAGLGALAGIGGPSGFNLWG